MSEKYSLLDAFLSLKDIDDDAALGMLKESKSVSINASNNDLAEAKEMLEDDDTEIEVIDPDADTIEHIKNKSDYVGQYILRCNKCKSNRFLDADKLVVDEDDDTQYNTEDECPNCHATGSGFELIGQVGKVAKDEPAEDQSAEEGTPGTPEGTLVDPVAVDAEFDNDLSSDEATFDNDVEFEEEEVSTETAEDETSSDTDGEEDLSRFDEPDEDDGMETDISEDDDSDVEEATLGDEIEEKVKKDDEDVTEAFKPNDDIVKMNKYAKEAWLMNKVISSMNNEEAYYGTWLYYWPDGCDEEECALTFNDREELEDLREVFESVYKDYHEDDLYEADDETLAYAHKQDALLGLKKIDNIKRKPHVAEKLTEAFDSETLKDLFALFIDPDSIRVIEVYDSESGKCVYEGSYSELTPDIKASKLVKFGVGPEEYLDARISTGATGEEPALASVLAGFVEGKGKIALFDVLDDGEEEELQVRDAAEATTVYGNAQLIDLGTPRVLKLFLDCPQMVAIEEVEKDDTKKLVEAILDANNLSSYKIDKPTSAEYWIQESIYSGEDLDYIFENFVKAHEQLAYQFKKITGYRTSLEEHFEQENGITTIDELYQKLYNKDMLKLTEDVQETSAQDDAEKDESPAPEPAQDKPDASAEKDVKPEPSVNSFKTRKELAEAIQECKDANKAYRIKRSDKAGYRYDLVEFFDNDEDLVEIESTEIDAVDASDVEIITPTRSTDLTAQMSEAEIITLNRIKDVSDDIADAIKKYYDIDADPRLITADIIQDLNLIAGKIRPEDLEPTFVNNITKEMYRSYNEFYEFADGLFSALTGETIHTTPEQKFVQAIRTLNSPAFSKETIDKTIGSRRFLTAARSGQIPYLNTAELPQLGEAAVCEKCHKAVCECDKTDLDEAVERYMIVTRTFNQGPDSNEVEVEKFVANSKEEADQKYEELVNMNLYDEVDQPIECFGEALALDQLTDATPDTSLVNTIRTAYTNGMLHKLRNIDGRNNAYYIDLMDIDRARLEAFFDKRDEFSKEVNNEGGILSTEYISDILDIEFFPTFMSIYRIPQNECLEEGVKKVTAQQFIDVLNGKDVVTESVNNPEPFDALDRKSRNIELYYEDVEVPYAYGARSWEDGSYEHEGEAIIDTSFYITPYEAAEVLWDIVTDKEAERFEDVSDDDYTNVVDQYIVDNLDDLIDKYMDNLLDYFREAAEQEAAENYDPTEYDGPEYEPDDYYDYYDESVNVDLNPFVHQINEYFDESYEDTVVFEATTGSVDAHGNIVVEGLLRSDSANSDVKFDLTPVKPLTEALTSATAGDVISKTIYRVTNNLSEESFTFSFKD